MNHELAKTLTIALVNYIDENRPEGTMDYSSGECVSLEKAFTEENFDSVEILINKKLSRLTEFEQEVSDIVEYCKEHGENVAFDYAKRHAKTLLALAKKELLKDDELAKKHLDGYCMGREDTLREMMDFLKSHFNCEKAREGTYYKDYERNPEPIPTGIPYQSPQCGTDVTIVPNTNSGTSTLKAEG